MPATFPNAGAHQILSPHMAQLNVGHFPTESPVVSNKGNFTTNFAFFYFVTLPISEMDGTPIAVYTYILSQGRHMG